MRHDDEISYPELIGVLSIHIEWTPVEDCLREVAEIRAQKKAEKKKRQAMNRAVKREEAKLAEVKRKLARAKLALIKGRL